NTVSCTQHNEKDESCLSDHGSKLNRLFEGIRRSQRPRMALPLSHRSFWMIACPLDLTHSFFIYAERQNGHSFQLTGRL
ncbi:hypothetical protein PENTCL1PPCAC_26553, partial [Pristionchus entomophagus]